MNCPSCGNSDVRRSRSLSRRDGFQRVLGRQAYRCRTCRQRFYCSAFEEPRRSLGIFQKKRGVRVVDFRRRKRMMRRVVTVVVFVVMFSLFGLFLRHISQDHPPQGNSQEMGSPNE
jgi:hypothetical protein